METKKLNVNQSQLKNNDFWNTWFFVAEMLDFCTAESH